MRLSLTAFRPVARTGDVPVASTHGGRRVDDLISARGAIGAGIRIRAGAYDDLENLSMIERQSVPERRSDSLGFWSLSMVEETPPGRDDRSSVLSLLG